MDHEPADWVYVLISIGLSRGKFEEIERDPLVLKAYLGEE